MKELAAYLLVVCLILVALIFAVNLMDPPEPILLVDASAPAPPNTSLFVVLPPWMGKPIWCAPPVGKRPHGYIERT